MLLGLLADVFDVFHVESSCSGISEHLGEDAASMQRAWKDRPFDDVLSMQDAR